MLTVFDGIVLKSSPSRSFYIFHTICRDLVVFRIIDAHNVKCITRYEQANNRRDLQDTFGRTSKIW